MVNDEEFSETVVRGILDLIAAYRDYGLDREGAIERYTTKVLNSTFNEDGRELGAFAFETLWDVYYG